MDPSIRRVENVLTRLVRGIQRVHLHSPEGRRCLDRSAYHVLGELLDNGPRRMSALADQFGLDLSTVSRQVRALETAGLIVRQPDPDDGRAHLLSLTESGRDITRHTREVRRSALHGLLSAWPADDVSEFARLLERFDTDIRAGAGTPPTQRDGDTLTGDSATKE